MTAPPTVLVAIGTRPEAIKLGPVILEARKHASVSLDVVSTGQHRRLVHESLSFFGVTPDHELVYERPTGSLWELSSALMQSVGDLLDRLRPAAVLVQGDTLTAFAGALCGFYAHIPVVHLEAGLRTTSVEMPFPEEAHRRLISRIAQLHLTPTTRAAANLHAEGVSQDQIVITGNTSVDAVLYAAGPPADAPSRNLVVVTLHRRESWGEPTREIGRALGTLSTLHPEVQIVVLLHPNPEHAEETRRAVAGYDRVSCRNSLPYGELCRLVARARLVLTDSGGLQEELPSLGVQAVVLRNQTDRPEAEASGWARVAGTDHDTIVSVTSTALAAPTEHLGGNPFGDGHAAERVVTAIGWMLGQNPRPADYEAEVTT